MAAQFPLTERKYQNIRIICSHSVPEQHESLSRCQVRRVDIRLIKNILTCQKGRETKSCKFLELLPTPYFLRKKRKYKKCTSNTVHRTFEIGPWKTPRVSKNYVKTPTKKGCCQNWEYFYCTLNLLKLQIIQLNLIHFFLDFQAKTDQHI